MCGRAIRAALQLLEGDWNLQRRQALVLSLTTGVTQWGPAQTLPGFRVGLRQALTEEMISEQNFRLTPAVWRPEVGQGDTERGRGSPWCGLHTFNTLNLGFQPWPPVSSGKPSSLWSLGLLHLPARRVTGLAV